MSERTAVIIGAGPAGLTAAYELLTRANVRPVVLEMSGQVGGLARTVNYQGNRMDIGGHRFFSKSDRVMQWWLHRMPLEKLDRPGALAGLPRPLLQAAASEDAPDPERTDHVMLLRPRKSRIYFLGMFFDYPIRLSLDTIGKLGPARTARIAFSYAKAAAFPYRHPANLEQFFINRFGRELYLTFFKSYTEKVWGEPCSGISAEWGAQRIKGLSVGRAAIHFLGRLSGRRGSDLSLKGTETSLIGQFLYPKYGPGQLWEAVAREICRRGGDLIHGERVTGLTIEQDHVTAAEAVNTQTGETTRYAGDYFFSTMPVRELILALRTRVPEDVMAVSSGLVYRDFITVGLLLKNLRLGKGDEKGRRPVSDNWIYIQEPDVRVGRVQVFNNWSPYMVADRSRLWIGLEYFCYDTDPLWAVPDADLIALAKGEMQKIGLIDQRDVLDGTVVRAPKAYPAYFGTYDRFEKVRQFVGRFSNLYLIGRNGMHRYNNQDHSMLTAMVAVDNVIAGRREQSNVWEVNTETEYHER